MVAQTRKRKAAQEQAAGKAIEAAPTSATQKRQKLPVRSKDDEEPAQKAAGKGTLITFDDNGKADQDLKVSAATRKPAPPTDEELQASEDSDDDAAPEAVSTAKAASDIKKSAQAAQKAAREQAATEKRKRQERDTLLKKQAEERKQAEEEAKTAAASSAQGNDDGDDDDEMDDGPSVKQQESTTRGRKRTDRVQIPSLLPAEFLTDSSSEDDDDDGDADQSNGPRPRKRNVSAVEKRLSRQDRGPRDERLGSTVYRVAKAADERLAPKVKKYSKSTKDVLLKRHRAGVKPRAGFFTKK